MAEMMESYQQRFSERKIEAQAERRVTFRTGKTVDLELSNSFYRIFARGGRLLLSVFRDITVRKQAEERERQANLELARSQAELRKKNEIMEDDLKMAREIQQAILPQQYPASLWARAPKKACCASAIATCRPARWGATSSMSFPWR